MININPDVESWTTAEVCRWLEGLGGAYTMYTTAFQYLNISGTKLLAMHLPDILATIGVRADLHRKRIQQGVLELRLHMEQHREEDMKNERLLSTLSKRKTHPVGEDDVDDILNRYAGDELNTIVVHTIEKSLPRLTTKAKEKILNMLNVKKDQSNQS